MAEKRTPRPPKAPPVPPPGALEVHEHWRSGRRGYRFDPATRDTTWVDDTRLTHSHEDGSSGHRHPETGCALLTIDKDAWKAATGLKGGGRKTYTTRPSGEQLAYVALTIEERTFTVVLTLPIPESTSDVDGAAVARLMLGLDMTPVVEDDRRRRGGTAAP